MHAISKQSAPQGGSDRVPAEITLGEFAGVWLSQQKTRLRPNSYRIYRSYLRHHIMPRLGDRQLSTITVDDVANLVTEMEQGIRFRRSAEVLVREVGKPFATPTILGVITVLGRIFSRACRHGLISSNPVSQLEKEEIPKAKRRDFPSLDKDAVRELIANTPARFRAVVALSVLTGLRQSETLGLRWQDIDTGTGLVRVRHQVDRHGLLVDPKTPSSRRDVPIPPSLARMLETHRKEARARGYGQLGDFVFCSRDGGPISRRNIMRRGLYRATKDANLPKLTWHDLRHVAASALIAEGASVPYLARILGHSSPAVTLSVYAHEFASAENADRTRLQMEAAFGDLLE